MTIVNEYISYKIYPKGVKSDVVESDIERYGIRTIYPISNPGVKRLNGFLKKIGKLPDNCDFQKEFVIYFIDYDKAPKEIPPFEEE